MKAAARTALSRGCADDERHQSRRHQAYCEIAEAEIVRVVEDAERGEDQTVPPAEPGPFEVDRHGDGQRERRRRGTGW